MKRNIVLIFSIVFGIFFSFSVRAATETDVLYERVKGRIILEVEKNGEAYFVSPATKKMFPLGRPSEAFALMKKVGIGISNNDLEKIPLSTDISANTLFSSKHKGKIFLQVQSKGEAWYVNPQDGKRYFLGRPDDAFAMMKKLGLGISDKNFSKISSFKRTLVAQTLPEMPLPKFSSCDEIRSILKPFSVPKFTAFGLESNASTLGDYSTTNVQVQGVDEADIVKTDGKYIYTISQNKLFIVNASNGLAKEGTIEFSKSDSPKEMFLFQGKLLVIGYRSGKTFVQIYDISNPQNPSLVREVEFDSSYVTSRLIGSYAYVVMNQSFWNIGEDDPILPMYLEKNSSTQERRALVECSQIEKIDPIISSQYFMIVSFPLENPLGEMDREVLLGAGSNVYASAWNLYVAKEDSSKTAVEKFSLDNGEIRHVGKGEVEGRILNQFSMDEYDEYFRIATTLGYVSRSGESASENRVYVLDPALKIVGKITDIAPGEQIYSARFMGPKGYLVTFKKVDPFFTLDLSLSTDPKVVGKLKIPGFSDYLHPYDENHIIGIGKDTVEAEEGNFAWYQGLKMAIFDVSDFANPKELHRVIIGDRGTNSEVLNDHKAFLFSETKKLLVIPIQLAEIDEELKASEEYKSNTYGERVFNGAFVFESFKEKGFQEEARISHGTASIRRSLYIGGTLYTISSKKIQAHSLMDFSLQGEISL